MEGYARIAKFMGRHPESALVSQFSDLNMQNILYLQAEIYGLREDLRQIEEQNSNASSEINRSFSNDWYLLAHTEESDGSDRQWQIMKELRPLLREYSKHLEELKEMDARMTLDR